MYAAHQYASYDTSFVDLYQKLIQLEPETYHFYRSAPYYFAKGPAAMVSRQREILQYPDECIQKLK